MMDWLRNLLMIFYAPVRGMRGMRDRGSLAPVVLIAFLGQLAFSFTTKKFAGTPTIASGGSTYAELFAAARFVVVVAVVLVPILTFVANLFERRGSFRVVITQEYASVAATILYVLTAANIFAILVAALMHYSGFQAQQIVIMTERADEIRAMMPSDPQSQANAELLLSNPALFWQEFFSFIRFMLFSVGVVLGVRDAFRMSAVRAFAVTVIAGVGASIIAPLAAGLFSGVLGSPFLLFILFMLLRGYFSDIMGSQRAKAAFKQNLESATLNPADA